MVRSLGQQFGSRMLWDGLLGVGQGWVGLGLGGVPVAIGSLKRRLGVAAFDLCLLEHCGLES